MKISLAGTVIALCLVLCLPSLGKKDWNQVRNERGDHIMTIVSNKGKGVWSTKSSTIRVIDLNRIVQAINTIVANGHFSTNKSDAIPDVNEYRGFFYGTNTSRGTYVTLVNGNYDVETSRRWVCTKIAIGTSIYVMDADISVLTNVVGDECYIFGRRETNVYKVTKIYFIRDNVGCCIRGIDAFMVAKYIDAAIQQCPIKKE